MKCDGVYKLLSLIYSIGHFRRCEEFVMIGDDTGSSRQAKCVNHITAKRAKKENKRVHPAA
jgi:hypothetical protein